MTEFTIDQAFLETCASKSLVGVLMMQHGSIPQQLKLVFPQTTRRWREKNGGPDQLILTEYTVPCLMEDIVYLIKEGVEVDIEMRDVINTA